MPFEPIPLTPLDHFLPPCTYTLLLYFDVEDVESGILDIWAGVNQLVYLFPFLEGNVEILHSAGWRKNMRHIVSPPGSWSEEEKQVLQVNRHLQRLLRFEDFSSLLPVPPGSGESLPVLRIAAHTFINGIVLAMTFHHSVFDGTGATLVVERLAQCCRKSVEESQPGTLCEKQTELRELVSNLGSGRTPRDFSDRCGPFELCGVFEWLTPTGKTHRFSFSPARVKKLKEACNEVLSSWRKAGDLPFSPSFLSMNDIVTSSLAICINRARKGGSKYGKASDTISLTMPANIRGKVNPPLNESSYMGNMFTNVYLQADLSQGETLRQISSFGSTCDSIDCEELSQVVHLSAKIRSELMAIDDECVRSLLAHLQSKESCDRSYLRYFGMSLNSWREFPLYAQDFGPRLGSISELKLHTMSIDGHCIIMPKRGVETDIEALLTLEASDMDLFIDDPLVQWLQG